MSKSNTALKGLVFLEKKNAILYEQLYPMLFEKKREPCEISFGDFDDFSYKICVDAETPNIVKLHVSYRCALEFKNNGSSELLARLFPGLDTSPDSSFDTCLQFDCDNPSHANNVEFLDNISSIKRHIMGGPMLQEFNALLQDKPVTKSPLVFAYKTNEYFFIVRTDSKVMVTFSLDVQDSTDRAMTKIFLQEFVESQRALRTAPPVLYTKDLPGELSSLKDNLNLKDTSAGFIIFSIEKRYIEGSKIDNAVTLLTGFRPYLLYHIKCTKTHLQMRMRKRVEGWLQVLNRAIPASSNENEKKTSTGKTFTRK